MTPESKDTVLRALQQYQGDDLYRAKLAFRHMNDEQLDSEYGQSGRTCREILDGYRQHNDRVKAAIAEVEALS